MPRTTTVNGRTQSVNGRTVGGTDIPDSVEDRPADTGSGNSDDGGGIEVSVQSEWTQIQARISGMNDNDFSHARIYTLTNDNLDTIIAEKDVSSLVAGDIVTFTESDLSQPLDNDNYAFFLINTTGDGQFTIGFTSDNGPYPSIDGEITIEGGVNPVSSPNTSTGDLLAFDKVGNINL